MAIIEFPKVTVDIKQSGYDNPRYFEIVLGSGEHSVLTKAVALALVRGVENTRKFVGATIDEYLLGAEDHAPDIVQFKHLEWEGLTVFIQKLATRGWVYGVTEKKSRLQGSKYILQTPQEMINHLRGNNPNYNRYTILTNKNAVQSLFFVPSQKFTQEVWGFTYVINDLEQMVEFKIPEE